MKKTHLQRAQAWMNRQDKLSRSRSADYSMLSQRMSLCYEPAVMLSRRNEATLQDVLQRAKELERVMKFKL